MDWAIHHCHGPVRELHAMDPPIDRRTVWTLAGDDDALVLGSAQDEGVVDRARCDGAGVDIVKRHSGGGAVLLRPGDYRWIDVVVPAGDPLWQDDVTRSFEWLGDVWSNALASVGLSGRRHVGPTRFREEGRVACFAGWSPGEVVDDRNKIIGMSQRRTRNFARFQCAFYREYHSDALADLLGDTLLASSVRDRLQHVTPVADADAVVAAFIDRLP